MATKRMAVQLEVHDCFEQATLERARSGEVRAHAEVCTASAETEASRCASGVLLLCASRVVRLVRPVAVPYRRGVRYGWEGLLQSPPHADELSDVLAALSVACELTAREVRALQVESTALDFLQVRSGLSLLSGDSQELQRKERR